MDNTTGERIFGEDDQQGLEQETLFPELNQIPDKIDHPFDPNQIKISRRVVTIGQIASRIEHGEVELAPDFQRRARIWDISRKSKLIESILLRIPLPVFYVAADDRENWRVVDGLQRLTTIYDFIHTESVHSFSLRGLEYLSALEGTTFTQLPRSIKRRIDETELNINVIESGTPDEVMFNVFKRINTGGITLNGQEIRHALNPGPARGFLLSLVESEEFRRATDDSVRDDRMGARELALRFCAFSMTSPESYYGGDLDGFLNDAMKRLNDMSNSERQALRNRFRLAMTRAEEVFGNDAFRKRYTMTAPRTPINRALFEAWSVRLAELSEGDFWNLRSKSSMLRDEFSMALMDNYEFERSVSVATGSRARVLLRFNTVQKLIKEVLDAQFD
ncbi:DUF262 domain-containing protein [Sphingosinicella sp. CPCC 101087]|uniref:DUF262 domain-containing protein n=1 Tax=Sphingosinicella sp. CPCC 101087 TaxID=2497754 RepID=UPI00101D4B6C|nr:DUF262 domain-containing protein [Sphingosinicella sp. CPCC 101087]